MKISQCYHIRIRDDNKYDLNVEEYIKEIEEKFSIDFRALPGWKQLIKRLHVMTTDCKRKIQNAKLRKAFIAQKLYIQYSRPSPFELSAKLARTGMRWRRIEMECRKKQRASSKSFIGGSPEWESMHPNTEQGEDSSSALQIHNKVSLSSDVIKITKKVMTKEIGLTTSFLSSLPPNISRNNHKLISPIQSQYSGLTPRTQEEQFSIETFSEKRSWMLLDPNLSIKCIPKEIIISEKSLKEQTLKFQLKNCSTEYILIRFKKLTDLTPFKSAKVLPVTTMKVYSGLRVTYKFIFELSQNKKEFTTQLYFKVGRKVLAAAPVEALCVPVVSKLMEPILRSVHVSEEVSIPPIFAWHMKPLSYPREYIKVIANGDYFYHLHIVKREPTLPKLSDSKLSTAVEGPDTDSLIEREIDFENNESKMLLSKTSIHAKSIDSKIKAKSQLANLLSVADAQFNAQRKIIQEEIRLIAENLVNLALDTFILGHTYMYIKPNDRKQISVYLTKIENIGSHNYYYDFNFYSPETEELVMTKTTRIYADILSHPIKIQPELLDMTQSPVVHGFCQDKFIVTNTHKIYPVNIKIKLTTKMKKLFTIIPMETIVPDNIINI